MLLLKVNDEIVLKILEMGDAPALFDLVENNRLYLRKWVPWVDTNITIEESKTVHVDRKAWRALSAGLQRATLREAVRRLKGDTAHLSYAAVEEARDVLNSNAGVGEIALMTDVRIDVAWKKFVMRHA